MTSNRKNSYYRRPGCSTKVIALKTDKRHVNHNNHKNNNIIILSVIFFLLSSCSPFDKFSNVSFFIDLNPKILINDQGATPSLKNTGYIDWTLKGIDEDDVSSFFIALGTSPGATDAVDWINVSKNKSYQFSKTLDPSTTYYVNIKYLSLSKGELSQVYTSSGFTTSPDKVDKVFTGGEHTCSINLRGFVKCWGNNNYGQLGYDDTINRGDRSGSMSALRYVDLGIGRSAKDLALGDYHTCAILDNDQVKCWGLNFDGELGYEDTTHRGNTIGSMALLGYVNLGVGRTAKSISAGEYHTCAILDNDQLKCWGANWTGQLGYDDDTNRGDAAGSMASLGYIYLGVGRTAKSVVAGSSSTCAILDNNLIKCWGTNGFGELGYDDTSNRGDTPGSMLSLDYVNIGAGRTAKSISLGSGHTCVLLDNNQVKCWGYNNAGQLGYDDILNRGVSAGQMSALGYVNLGVGRTAKLISLGYSHSCAVLDNDQVKCWGGNYTGQLGYNDTNNRGNIVGSMASLGYLNLGFEKSAKFLVSGGSHSCTILDNDQVKCWGSNSSGELGYDDTEVRGINSVSMGALSNVNLGSGRTVKSAELGHAHSCAILDNNQVKCWGYNLYGQLGYDDTADRGGSVGNMSSLSYVDLGIGRTAKSIALGVFHTCVILDNDQVKCWGSNGGGELGYDDTSNKGTTAGSMAALGYVDLGVGRTAKSISLGYSHSCAILDNDQIKCWGANWYGQLGYDDISARGASAGSMAALGYVDLGVGRTAKSISLGHFHSCAILDNNQLKCWGYNASGQLGYDSTVNKGNTAGSMAGLGYVNLGIGRTAKSVSLGFYHSCAILDNDKLKCWGYNGWSGNLGYEDGVYRGNVPGSMSSLSYVNIGAGRTAKSIASAGYHNCVILDNNNLKCWGYNNVGQLGYGNTISNRGNYPGTMDALSYVNLGIGRTAKSVFVGSSHTCGILDNDQLKCWGSNYYGQLGYDDSIGRGIGSSTLFDAANLVTP